MRSKLTYANVTSTLALVVALTAGTAYAANEWTGANIVNESLTGADVKGRDGTADTPPVNGSIGSADISGQPPNVRHGTPFVDGALTTWDIMDGAIRIADIAQGAVTNTRLAADAVTTDKIAPETITGADVQSNSLDGSDITGLTGGDVMPDSLYGSHINESSLSMVPSAATAARGGIGRSASRYAACDPESETFVDCGYTTLTLPGNARVLVIARISSWQEANASVSYGDCRLVTSAGVLAGTQIPVGDHVGWLTDHSLVTVTGVMGPGTYDFGIECNQFEEAGAIWYWDAQVAAVALSPN